MLPIDLGNKSIYGLNATVFSNDIDRVDGIARRLSSGTVGHNAFRSDFTIAFGGFKQSGIGCESGREGIHTSVEAKTTILDEEPSTASTHVSNSKEEVHS